MIKTKSCPQGVLSGGAKISQEITANKIRTNAMTKGN